MSEMSVTENLLFFLLDRWGAKIMTNKDGGSHIVIFPAAKGDKKVVSFSKGSIEEACVAACLAWHDHQEGMWTDEQIDQLIAHAQGTEDKDNCPWCKALKAEEQKLVLP
jgi:hypothetical protein